MSAETRTDYLSLRRTFAAFALFCADVGGILLWGFNGGSRSPLFIPVFFAGLAIGLASMLFVFLPLTGLYWCRRCKRRLRRVGGLADAMRYHCPACDIDWKVPW